MAIFPVHAEKAGDIATSAAIMMPNLQRLQQGAAAPETHTFGGRGDVLQLKVQPGAVQFQSMIAKKKDVPGEQVELSLGSRSN